MEYLMNLKKLYLMLCLSISVLSVNSTFIASETETTSEDTRFEPADSLKQSVKKAVTDTNFNGSVIISQNNDSDYNILYQDAIGTDDGYNIDTLYDVGSVTKLYTTTAIMTLEQEGKLAYSDKISKYIDNVPTDKQGVTIEMLLTHTSGIYAEENDNHDVSKESEVARILKSKLLFTPGTNYKYSNAGFTLLAVIIEAVSGESYEDYLTEALFEPLGLEHTGFPNSRYLKNEPAVSGTLDGVSYGNVTDFDFGWYSKGYSDILTTPRELTYFFQALISGKLLTTENLKLMNLDDVDLGGDAYRGYGTDVKHYGTKQGVVGHTGIWYGGNTVVYYRPADKTLFVLACDQLNVSNDLPANYVFNTLNAMYPAGKLKSEATVETVPINDLNIANQSLFNIDHNVSETNNNELVDPLTKSSTTTSLKYEVKRIINYLRSNPYQLVIGLSVLFILLLIILFIRIKEHRQGKKLKAKKAAKKAKKAKAKQQKQTNKQKSTKK